MAIAVRSGMAIERWPATERPRERLYWNGADALADAELLALQLGSGRRGKTAVEVAREMLAAYGSLAGVAGREAAELAKLPGVGPAKAARLASAFELTRRLRARTPGIRIALSSPAEVYAAFGPLMKDLPREVFRVALLDAQNGLLRDLVISEGTLSRGLQAGHPRVRGLDHPAPQPSERRSHAEPGRPASHAPACRGGAPDGPAHPRSRRHRPRPLRQPGREGYYLTRRLTPWESRCATSGTWC